jgi:hypothetical protein
MYKRGLLTILLCLDPLAGKADSIDGQWSIVGFTGEAWFVNPQELIGKTQEFSGGSASGPLYACDFAGQSMTYNVYENDDFFANPEFVRFLPLKDGMTLSSSKLFVHRITCNGNDQPMARRVLYPIVTNEARASAWYLYEGGVVELFRP